MTSRQLSQEVYEAAANIVTEESDVIHCFKRMATLEINGATVELDQIKYAAGSEENASLKALGATAFATSEWFNDVTFEDEKDDPHHQRTPAVYATYPVDYFPDVRPNFRNRDGSPVSYCDAYGVGHRANDEPWEHVLLDPIARSARTIRGDNPTEVEDYKDRFKWYLEQLTQNPTVVYDQRRYYLGRGPSRRSIVESVFVRSLMRKGSRELEDDQGTYPIDQSANITTRNNMYSRSIYVHASGANPAFTSFIRKTHESTPVQSAPDKMLAKVLNQLVDLGA